MKATVYDCTQKKLIGYFINLADYESISKILDEKHGILQKGERRKDFHYDYLIMISPKRFILKSSNMSIWCKTNENVPLIFGNRSFVTIKI